MYMYHIFEIYVKRVGEGEGGKVIEQKGRGEKEEEGESDTRRERRGTGVRESE